MDHYNEQLVRKQTEASDTAKRVLIGAGTVILSAAVIFAMLLFAFPMLLIIVFGIFYLSWFLLSGTVTEYEYIVTNSDLDIDKITGKRKRKRLITVNLNNVTEWGEYTDNTNLNTDATVMASDASGIGAWYLVAKHDKLGEVAVIFTPTEETAVNINHGVPYSQRKRELTDIEIKENATKAEQEEQEQDNQ